MANINNSIRSALLYFNHQCDTEAATRHHTRAVRALSEIENALSLLAQQVELEADKQDAAPLFERLEKAVLDYNDALKDLKTKPILLPVISTDGELTATTAPLPSLPRI